MGKQSLQKYGAPLYAVYWVGDYAYMCGGGNLGIENKYVGSFSLGFFCIGTLPPFIGLGLLFYEKGKR